MGDAGQQAATPTAPVVLVCASANPDKVAEIAAVLAPDVVLEPRPADVPDVVEDAPTLEGNARLKAVAICAATGRAAVADDTGLEVDALGGAPGVISARYAGDDVTYADNVAKLLAELAGVPGERRSARFRTVCVALFPDGRELAAEGVLDGGIGTSPAGANGFGYDPVFVLPDGRTLAQLTADEKNSSSHRARAIRALAAKLAER